MQSKSAYTSWGSTAQRIFIIIAEVNNDFQSKQLMYQAT